MWKAVIVLFCTISGYSQSFDLEGKTFKVITESICGDGSGYTYFLYLHFEKEQVKIVQEYSPILSATEYVYKIKRKWLRNGNKILIAKVSEKHSVDDFSFEIKDGKLVGKDTRGESYIFEETKVNDKVILDFFQNP